MHHCQLHFIKILSVQSLSHSLKYCTTVHIKIYRILMKLQKFKIGIDKPILLRLPSALMVQAWSVAGILITSQD